MKQLLLILTFFASLLPAQERRPERDGSSDTRPRATQRDQVQRLEQRLEAMRERLQQLREHRTGADSAQRLRPPTPRARQGQTRGQLPARMRAMLRERLAERMRQHQGERRGNRPGFDPRSNRRPGQAQQPMRHGTQRHGTQRGGAQRGARQ